MGFIEYLVTLDIFMYLCRNSNTTLKGIETHCSAQSKAGKVCKTQITIFVVCTCWVEDEGQTTGYI